MEERTCKTCKETFPLTEEFFYQVKSKGYVNFRGQCKDCYNANDQYNKKLRKLKEEKAKELNWQEKLKDKKFICKICGHEKPFEEMRVDNKNKKVEARCKKCFNEKHKKYNQMWEANVYVKVAEEKRRKNNEK